MKLGEQPGPLAGLRIVEIGGIGPGPHACMILADLGADVIRIDRPGGQDLVGGPTDFLLRGRPSIALDLKHPAAVDAVLDLVETADVLVEGMRPGTMERLGLGPQVCTGRNGRLVYARMTGWGQTGPLANTAGHDLNYIAVSGALDGFGQDEARPHFPSNVVGDFGGGSTYLVIGILSAVIEAARSGVGQVVDAAIVDGTAHLNAMASSFLAAGELVGKRRSNLLDGGRAYYDVYQTSDGRHMSVAALEPKFYAEFCRLLGIDVPLADRDRPDQAEALRQQIADRFAERTQREWTYVFEGSDACVSPIVSLAEAPNHPHLRERGVFVEHEGHVQPAPAPRFSRTSPGLTTPPPTAPGANTAAALTAWGITNVDDLIAQGAATQTSV